MTKDLPDDEQQPIHFSDTKCGHIMGCLLVFYGLFNSYLFLKFTPVYVATECGDQMARLKRLHVSTSEVEVSLEIQVTCWNPNAYQVSILTSKPGRVWIGDNRDFRIGNLSLVQGSRLPESGYGNIRVQMDAALSPRESLDLGPQFFRNEEVPVYLELQFDVGVNVNFGLNSFAVTAQFQKKCGMNLKGVLSGTESSRLGELICRDSFKAIDRDLPHVGKHAFPTMSFSAAQMDPDRVAMGEKLKNVSLLSVGGLSYVIGVALLWRWLSQAGRTLTSHVSGARYAEVVDQSSATCGVPHQERTVVSSSGHRGFTAMVSKSICTLLGYPQCDLCQDEPPQTEHYEAGPEQQPTTGYGQVVHFLSCGVLSQRRNSNMTSIHRQTQAGDAQTVAAPFSTQLLRPRNWN